MAVLFTVTSHTNSGSLTDPQRRAFLAGLGTGFGTLAVGAGALFSLRRSNLYRTRIDVLEDELDGLQDEYRAIRREQKARARYGVIPALSTGGVQLSLRVCW